VYPGVPPEGVVFGLVVLVTEPEDPKPASKSDIPSAVTDMAGALLVPWNTLMLMDPLLGTDPSVPLVPEGTSPPPA
jgi:hypothetical protein